MADLILKEKIEVETNHGHCEIHLNFGSITKLKREDAVDVLVISAFPGICMCILATFCFFGKGAFGTMRKCKVKLA